MCVCSGASIFVRTNFESEDIVFYQSSPQLRVVFRVRVRLGFKLGLETKE